MVANPNPAREKRERDFWFEDIRIVFSERAYMVRVASAGLSVEGKMRAGLCAVGCFRFHFLALVVGDQRTDQRL